MSINITHYTRSGHQYEEAWGLYFVTQWLKNPSMYQNILFQTNPDEIDSSKFYLDDIIIRTKNNSLELYQIKHTSKPIDWDYLTKKKPKGTSLLSKWSQSYKKINDKKLLGKAELITNGEPNPEILKYLSGNKIDIQKIKSSDKILYDKILLSVDADILESFFSNFNFNFNEKSLESLRADTSNVLINELRATKSGVKSLILKLRSAFTEKHPKEIYIHQIKLWCEFDEPKVLNEEFEIPKDFQYYDETKHHSLLKQLTDINGGVNVIIGKPGSGKSTYLSNLYRELKSKELVCIRHHYHLSPLDHNPMERIMADRVIEGIKEQFKRYNKTIGFLDSITTQNISLRELINESSKHCIDDGNPLIIIIDGLDHAISKDKTKTELESFLKEICHPQKGVWFIIGMQEVAKSHLPSVIYEVCPEDNWLSINGLNDKAIDSLVQTNSIQLNLPVEDSHINPILRKLRELSENNPLHLRYTLANLKTLRKNDKISVYDLKNLYPYNNTIVEYYNCIWRDLNLASKSMLIVIELLDIPLKEKEYFSLMGEMVITPERISSDYSSISHLIYKKRSGIHIYHNSLKIFIESQSEWSQQRISILKKVKNWLNNSNYANLKWELLPLVCYELGDSSLLLEIDREWVINAMCNNYSRSSIEKQLFLANKISFLEEDYKNSAKFSLLNDYYYTNSDYNSELSEKLWITILKLNNSNVCEIDISELSNIQLKNIAELHFKQSKDNTFLEEIFTKLNNSHNKSRISKKGEIGASIPDLPLSLLRVMSYCPEYKIVGIVKYIQSYSDDEWSDDLLAYYVRCLSSLGEIDSIHNITSIELSNQETEALSHECAIYNLNHKADSFQKYLETLSEKNHPLAILYLLLSKSEVKVEVSLPDYNLFNQEIDDFDTKTSHHREKLFYHTFLNSLICYLNGKSEIVEKWILDAPLLWPLKMMTKIIDASRSIALDINKKKEISIEVLFEEISAVETLQFPKDRKLYEWQRGLYNSINHILLSIIYIKNYFNQNVSLDFYQIMSKSKKEFFSELDLLKFLCEFDKPLLSQKSINEYLKRELHTYEYNVKEFYTRVEHYLDLGNLALIHSDKEHSEKFIKKAASNIISYGSHKDPFLGNIMDAIELCHNIGSKKTDEWVSRIAPIVKNIKYITDGDDMNHFPEELGKLLSIVNPNLLYKYYNYAIDCEKLLLAEKLFKHILNTLDYSKDISVAIASTAIDNESLPILREIAKTNVNAKKASDKIDKYFGEIEFIDRFASSNHSSPKILQEDINSIQPNQLLEYLGENYKGWDRHRYLEKWAPYWLQKDNQMKNEAFGVLCSLIDDNNPETMDGEILDLIIEELIERDREKAFEYLCWAQANLSGWSLYFTSRKKAEKRWALIKKVFPKRYKEFYQKSVEWQSKRYGKESYFFPIPRGVEYFSLFDKKEVVEEITEIAVSSLEDLMADLKLPEVEWLSESDVDLVDLLFNRLKWASPYVQERTSIELSNLLSKENLKGHSLFSILSRIDNLIFKTSKLKKLPIFNSIFYRYCNWLDSQTLESSIANGILPFIKAIETNQSVDKYHLNHFLKCINYSSIIIEKLIEEISRILNEKLVVNNNFNKARSPSPEYKINDFFKKHLNLFLPSYFTYKGDSIQKRYNNDIYQIWSYESDKIIEELGLKEEIGDVSYFLGDKFSPLLTTISTKLSEVYLTAFIRTLNKLFEEKKNSSEDFSALSFKTLPIDLSYWKLLPSRLPDYWPKITLKGELKETSKEIIGIEIDKEIQKIIEGIQNNKILLGLDGKPMSSNKTNQSKINAHSIVVSFGYKIIGKDLPQPEELSDMILKQPHHFINPDIASKPFSFLESFGEHEQTHKTSFRINDLICYPIVARPYCVASQLWQPFRHSSSLTLTDLVKEGLNTNIEQYQLTYLDSNKVVVASGDWLEGLQERHTIGSVEPHGSYILADKEFIDQFLNKHDLRLAYLVTNIFTFKNYSYEDVQEFKDHKFYNLSSIIE